MGQVIGLGYEGMARASALVQFADGDQDLAGGKLDRQVGTWLVAARVADLDLRGEAIVMSAGYRRGAKRLGNA
jgi:hypothetical protein